MAIFTSFNIFSISILSWASSLSELLLWVDTSYVWPSSERRACTSTTFNQVYFSQFDLCLSSQHYEQPLDSEVFLLSNCKGSGELAELKLRKGQQGGKMTKGHCSLVKPPSSVQCRTNQVWAAVPFLYVQLSLFLLIETKVSIHSDLKGDYSEVGVGLSPR